MMSEKLSGDIIKLDKSFSTTRRVIKNNQLLTKQLDRNREGGLRTRGYFKSGELNKPVISVITVVYNGKEYIERAILSVIEQTYDNVEYIIIDGGSSDGTLDIIKKYDEVLDYWVSEPDQGVYDAMNKGIKLFQGDYVLFLGCDDSLFDVFHEVVGYFNDTATSYYGNVILSTSGDKYDGRFYPLKLFTKNIPHQAIFYSKHVFDEYNYNCNYITVADYDLNLKIFSNNKYGLKYIPQTIAYFNNKNGISSTLVDHNFSKEKSDIIRKHYSALYYFLYTMLVFIFKRKILRA